MRKRAIKGLAAVLILAACQGDQPAAIPSITAARVTFPAVPGVPGAGYFTLNGGGAGDALIGVTSPAAERIEMHESGTDARGVSIMRPVAEVPLGSGQVVFAPGGKHLMVYGLAPDIAPGTQIELTFRFRSAAPVNVRAPLGPAGTAAMDEHSGH